MLTCYVRENDGSLPRELRGNTFDGDLWGELSYYISDEDSDPNYELPDASQGWGTNIVALSDGKAYAFWQYLVGSYVKLYFNEYYDGWEEDYEKSVYDDSEAPQHYSRYHNACVDQDDNIHLVYSDDRSGQNEIYYLAKGPHNNNFGDFPGYHVSTIPTNRASEFPYCAVSNVADTTFLHVVWCSALPELIYYRYWNSVTDAWSAVVDTIAPEVLYKYSEKPSVACDSYGNVHVVWEEELEEGSFDLVKYRKFDYAEGEWGAITILPANEEEIDAYGMPVIISDVYDNLHVLMTGRCVEATEPDDDEAYYSFYDAPPHIEDLEFLADESDEDSVVISWTGWDEPDLDVYKIYRKYPSQSWEYVNSTTNTRYSDTESSYSPSGFSQIDYYVVAVDDADQETYSDTIIVLGLEQHKLIADGYAIARYDLSGNYPNPFNAQTTIKYNLAAESNVTLEIFDLLGRKIGTLVNEIKSPGPHAVTWDASQVASGMYFYRIQAGDYSAARRMSVVK